MSAVKFGLFYPQVGADFATIRERARLAEQLGFHSLWFVDHMWSRGMEDLDHLEAWTLMAATAATTHRIAIGSLVLCNSYRSPALLAKMAASLDNVSGGRLLLGLGAGWMEEEYRAYGYAFPPARVRIEQLDEALAILKLLFTQGRASFEGRYYSIHDAVNNPKPLQKPHPPILIGGAGERLLRVAARHADIWNCPNNAAAELAKKLDRLRRHCDAVGRDPDSIEVSEQCVVVLGRNQADLASKLAAARATVGTVFDIDSAGLIGTPDRLIERIAARSRQGVRLFTILFADLNAAETLTLFGERVLPAFV